ncbi:glucosamine inositolphosphorylceramide transferase family protein [Flavihumibacter profundi]|uniref:glucosamine inositolphosphorylceramide transferase family protein n=1 Tax=Flavihumibacter profundi TaxID=2716883 RepID=UPI001CC7F196|nr:hypothetical protein [Flavihumibacter profundi]MBZ5855771.1 hypothetical protein [Flavihumibacter profundi]
MNFTEKILDKLYYKQWTIGIGKLSPEEFIREKKTDFHVKWLDLGNSMRFLADPFFAETKDGGLSILVEDFRSEFDYGILSLVNVKPDMKEPVIREIMNTGSHLSYPFLWKEGDKTYLIPEAGASGSVPCYLYDIVSGETKFVKNLFDQTLIDPTIIKKDGKYWLFATMASPHHNNHLHLFSAEHFLGPYTAHTGNPIVTGLKGSRPAGNIFEVDGSLYRPAQDCSGYYGGAMVIKKITLLSDKGYAEEDYMEILPRKGTKYDFGIHTINFFNGYVVVDGLRRFLAPIEKARHILAK